MTFKCFSRILRKAGVDEAVPWNKAVEASIMTFRELGGRRIQDKDIGE